MSSAGGAPSVWPENIDFGDLVFIKSDGDKNKSRDLYLVMNIQKIHSSKFLSRQYEVQLTNIFHDIAPSSSNQIIKPVRGS